MNKQHEYGQKVHIIGSNYTDTILAYFSSPDTKTPKLIPLLNDLYYFLFDYTVSNFFPLTDKTIETRMETEAPFNQLKGEFVNEDTPISIISIARAGINPSLYLFEKLHNVMNYENIRVDHLYMARETDENNLVTGVNFTGSKIGGDFKDRILLIPDPMGATGSTIKYVYDEYYKNQKLDKPLKLVAMHLIVTPEYIKLMSKECPDLEIVCLRIDRGFSSEKAKSSIPGAFIDEEFGLNKNSYIVPGAGGIGELLNNSFC